MKSNSFGCHEKISTTCHFHWSHYESSIQTGESIFSETVLNIPILALSPMFSLPRTPFKLPLSESYFSGSYYINKYLCVLPSPQWFLPPLNSCSIYSLFHFFAFCLILVSCFHKKFFLPLCCIFLEGKDYILYFFMSSTSLYTMPGHSRYSINVFDVIYFLIWH